MKRYKGFLLATIGSAALAPVAQAADLPVKAAPYAPQAIANWAGFYMGVHLGGASQRSFLRNDDYSSVSFLGGGQIGVNWQDGNFVYGLEADGSWLSKSSDAYLANGTASVPPTYGTHVAWLSTVRGRFGYAFGTRSDWMVYGTAGLAIGKVEARNDNCCVTQQSYSKTKLGWALGGGLEHMLNRNWTVGFEALYVDFGSSRLTNAASVGNNKSAYVQNSLLIGRLKLNYKF